MKVLTTIDLLALPSLETPPAGHVGFGAKSDGLYQKVGTVETKLSIDGHTHTITQITGLQGALDSKATPSDISTAVNNLEIGGRNLFKKSTTLSSGLAQWYQPKHNDVNGFTTPSGWESDAMITVHNVFPSQGRYTVSGYYVNTYESNREFRIYIGDALMGTVWAKDGIPSRFEIQVEVISLEEDVLKVWAVGGSGTHTIDFKVEKGNKATDWTPAPEDQVSDWSTTDVTSFSYIKNKPTQLSQFTDNIGVASHIANKANPHNVTTAQIGALPLTGGTLSGNLRLYSNIWGSKFIDYAVLTLTPPTHTGGPWNHILKDDLSKAYYTLAYGAKNVFTVDHLGTTTILGNVTAPTFIGVLSGNASSATKLQTARTIAGVSFDGTANIDIPFANLASKPTTLSGYGITDGVNKSLNLTAGNGLTGGGTLEANRTFALGTPSTLTSASTNAVTSTSHTHAITTTTVGAPNTIVATDASGGVRGNIIRIGSNWTLELSGTELVFKYNGVIKQRMLSDGTILATGGVTALATN